MKHLLQIFNKNIRIELSSAMEVECDRIPFTFEPNDTIEDIKVKIEEIKGI